MSMITALSACQLDNSDAKKVPANFNNEFETQIGFDGTKGETMQVEITFGHGNATGVIGVTDVNYGEADPDYTLVPEAMYGTFTMTEAGDGEWAYDLDETHSEVAALRGNPNATLTDTLTLTSVDGTQDELEFVIKGTDSTSEAEFRGALVANVSLTGTFAAGTAEVYDANFEESYFQTDIAAQYGEFTIEPSGRWTYQLDKRHPDLQSLITPEDSTSETFMLKSTDGTEVEFTVNITGAPLNFAAQIPSETDLTSVFAIDLRQSSEIGSSEPQEGKLLFRAKITEDLLTTAKLGMTCSRWNGNNDGGGDNRRLAQFYVDGDKGGEFSMWSAEIVAGGSYENGSADYAKDDDNKFITDKVIFDHMFTPGEWTDIEMTWQYDAGKALNYLTLSFDDTPASSEHGAIPADPTQKIVAQSVAGSSLYKCLNEMRFFVQKNAEKGGLGALLIDDIKFYKNINADVLFDTADFEESFSTNNAGDLVKDISNNGTTYYKNITTDNITVVRDL